MTGFVGMYINGYRLMRAGLKFLNSLTFRNFTELIFGMDILMIPVISFENTPLKMTDHDDFEFIDSLLKVIETCKLKHTGAAVNSRLFLELTPDERRYLTTAGVPDKNWDNRGCPSDPWYAAFQAAIVSGAARFAPEGVKIFPFFDRRDSPHQQKQPKQDKARELYNEILDQKPPLSIRSKLGDILTFGSRETMKGLQAADLLCNRARLYVAEGFGDDLLSVRIRDFLEKGNGYIQMLGLRGMDLALRACPFRSTFWLADELPSLTVPDYLERMHSPGPRLHIVVQRVAPHIALVPLPTPVSCVDAIAVFLVDLLLPGRPRQHSR